MRRLYLQIYLAVLAALVLFVLLALIGFKVFKPDPVDNTMSRVIAQLAGDLIPPGTDAAATSETLKRWHERLGSDITVFDGSGMVIASAGLAPLPYPSAHERHEAIAGELWSHGRNGASLLIPLAGDRLIVGTKTGGQRWFGHRGRGFLSILTLLTLVGVAVAIVAFPLARRLTRRVESLQGSVQAFGQGELSARAAVKGRDEVARLAESFNLSADRIEALIQSQKTLLANASHELRSPLARIRLASELLDSATDATREQVKGELQQNVTELDELVDEILLASRLDAQSTASTDQTQWIALDFGGLVAEEAARAGLVAQVESLPWHADARLLRRLVRNLIENAVRYGVNRTESAHTSDIVITVKQREAGRVVLSVCDRGPGIAESERERIFEPFYRAQGASERSGGVGLGLSLVRQIAQLHHGQVRCQPREGGGSCFIAQFPGRTAEQ